MEIVIETGSARMQAKFKGGSDDGKNLYEVKQFQVKTEWATVQ